MQLGMVSSDGKRLTLGGKQAGRRTKAGRPPKGGRAGASHQRRPEIKASVPVHVVLRVERDLQTLRQRSMYQAIRKATLVVLLRMDVRIVHLSIQKTHVHLLVEADHRKALADGLRAFQISAAKHINRVAGSRGTRRRGRVFADRYFAEPITNRRQAHRALGYVLNNWRKHLEDFAEHTQEWFVDPFSTAMTFPGWKERRDIPPWPASYAPLAVKPARTWLLRQGWERYGPISCFDVPSQRVSARS